MVALNCFGNRYILNFLSYFCRYCSFGGQFEILGLTNDLHPFPFEIWSSYVWILTVKLDAKNSDKANAIRSKHSVTEQRRRSKINERYI